MDVTNDVMDRTELEGLQTEAKATLASMDVVQGQIDLEKAGAKDETKLTIMSEEWEKKSADFDEITAKVDAIKDRIRNKAKLKRESVLDELNAMTESKIITGKNLSAMYEGKDQQNKMHMQAVADYIHEGKSTRDYPEKFRRIIEGKTSEYTGIKLPPKAVELILGQSMTAKLNVAQDFMNALEGKASCSGTGDYSTLPYASQNADMTAAAIWTEYKRRLLDLPGEPADILSRVTMVPAESGAANWVRVNSTDALEYGQVVASWLTCEGDNKPATQVKFEAVDISCYELCAYTEITDRALKRSRVPIETILATKFRDAVKHAIETAVLVGTGAGQPDGVIDVAGIHQVTRLCNLDVQCEDLIELVFSLRRQHRPGSIFVMQDDAAKEMMKDRFGGTDCECVVYCFDGNSALGYPVHTTHRLPAVGTDGDVLFGDFREYVLAVEQDVILARSDVAGDMFRKNSTAFKIYTIVGGEVVQPRAFAQLVSCVGGSCCCAT